MNTMISTLSDTISQLKLYAHYLSQCSALTVVTNIMERTPTECDDFVSQYI